MQNISEFIAIRPKVYGCRYEEHDTIKEEENVKVQLNTQLNKLIILKL